MKDPVVQFHKINEFNNQFNKPFPFLHFCLCLDFKYS